MATLGANYIDLIDVYKQKDASGQFVEIIEMLAETNPILDDAIAVECNSGASHVHTVRGGLPSLTWGLLYQGIPNSKSTKVQVTDTTGFVEGRSEVDERLLKLSGDEATVRLAEASAFVEAMNQEVASKIFYGNSAVDPEQFMGLAPRFNSSTAANGGQVIKAGGAGADNTSIWFVTWGDNQCQLLYPKGTMAGLDREDYGRQQVLDGSGNPYFAKVETFRWHVGLAVKDWRYVVRICNIDVSLARAGSVALYDYMMQAYYKLQNRRVPGGKIAIYCNRDMMEVLDKLAHNAGASDNFIRLSPMEIQGKEVMTYRGIPIRETDAIINTEELVV